MSLRARALNTYLRWTEKRMLARADDVDALRRQLAFKARLFFHGPGGTSYHWDKLGDVPVQWVLAKGVARDDRPVILYFHGGGYAFGSTDTHRAMLAHVSALCRLPVCMVEYRLAPEHPFPAAFDDAVAAFAAMSEHDTGVILGGDSAGGGLALSLLAEILRRDMPKPIAAFAFSPFTDMTFSGASLSENAQADVMLPAKRISEISDVYLAGNAASDPRVSPLFAEFDGAPPVWLTVGTTEILRDDTTRMSKRLQSFGGQVTQVIEDDLPHVWPIFHPVIPEARKTLTSLADWIKRQSGSNDS
jgi:acetyl esterase/lipase